MALPVIDRYILRDILQTWAAVMAVLVLILATNSLAYMLGKVVEGKLATDVVIPLFMTSFTHYLVTMIPLGLFLGLMLAFGRFYAETEMAAMAACGVGTARLYRPVMIAGVIAALIAAGMAIWVSPWAKRVEADIKANMESRSELAGIAPGRFNRSTDGEVVLFVASIEDDTVLKQVFVEVTDDTGESHLVRAERAREQVDPESGASFLVFEDGYRYSGTPGSADFRVVQFERHGIRLTDPQPKPGVVGRSGWSMARLWQSGRAQDRAELEWRLAMPIACLMLALVSVPLSQTTPRKGRYGKIALGLVLYLAYSNVLVVARNALADGDVPLWLGMWWAHGLTLGLILLLLGHRLGWRWTGIVLGRAVGVKSP